MSDHMQKKTIDDLNESVLRVINRITVFFSLLRESGGIYWRTRLNEPVYRNIIFRSLLIAVLILFYGPVLHAGTPFVNQNDDAECCPELDDDQIWGREELSAGITWKYAAFDSLFGAPQYINLLVMHGDTAARWIQMAAADDMEVDRRFMRPSDFARQFTTLAVVNGGFFSDHPEYVNTGIFKWKGLVYPFMKEETEELQFVGSSAAGIDSVGNWLFMNRKGPAWADDWPEAASAIAGAHRLLEAGNIPEPVLSSIWRSERETRHAGLRHPRTAICLTGDNRIILLVADGRHEQAQGLNLNELAQVMQRLGCRDAVNLDGGGSSTMYIEGRGVVNHPSDNRSFDNEGERPVRTVLIVRRPGS
jgi:hypothetical protein